VLLLDTTQEVPAMAHEPERKKEEMRPVYEAGGGEAEGFEQAEDELIENASHGEGNPALDEFPGEAESDLSGAEYGEPDEVDSTEVTQDPEDPDDPGAGPGIAAER
jgi:hypothetical protein